MANNLMSKELSVKSYVKEIAVRNPFTKLISQINLQRLEKCFKI